MDKPFSPSTDTPFQAKNYYMQIIINKIKCKRAHPSIDYNYSFSILKGSQSFGRTEEVTVPSNCHQTVAVEKCKLNFMVNDYNPEKNNDFRLTIAKSIDEKRLKEVGEYFLLANKYIDQYIISENGAFDLTVDLNQQFAAQIQLYVYDNQHGLFRLIRGIKNPKTIKQSEPVAPKIKRQRIIDTRKEMDEEAEKEARPASKEKKFTKFSPRRQLSEEKKKTDMLGQKRKEEEAVAAMARQRESEELNRLQEEQRNKNRNRVPIVKKEWIIPAAEEIKQKMLSQTKVKRKLSKQSEKNTEDRSKVNSVKEGQKSKSSSSIQDQSFLKRLPIPLKYLIPLLIILLAGAGYFLFSNSSEQQLGKASMPKARRGEKVRGKGRVKK